MNEQKILFICLAAYKVPNIGGHDPEAMHRQEVYAIALDRLLKLATPSTSLIVVDNTVSDVSELSPSLAKQFANEKIKDVVLVNNNVLGAKNKGAGEYVMCQAVLGKHSEFVKQFDWVVYYTSRYPFSYPLVFEYLEKFKDKEAIVSNADYLYADGESIASAPGNFNDVVFAMKTGTFLKFVDSMDPEHLAKLKMNSETNLFNYLHENKIDFEEVYHWGILRYNYASHKAEVI